MRRDEISLDAPWLGGTGTMVAHGHYGRPVLVFPSEQGRAIDFENNGMVAAVGDLVEGGKAKLYCIDSFDQASWSDASVPLEERARRHAGYERWVLERVVPAINADCGGEEEVGEQGIATLGVSLGAYHSLNFALKHAHLFPLALCFSGSYDPGSWKGWGERGEQTYFNNPTDYVQHLHGGHLDWLRSRLSVLLVVGQGQWEDTTGSLAASHRMASLLAAKGIRHEFDVWGHDSPHDWPSWRRQIAKHLPRFC
jgi:esterase/lipase superfamily enzyme